ncbi:hypothetical protein [Glutamicibacter ardleyensis]
MSNNWRDEKRRRQLLDAALQVYGTTGDGAGSVPSGARLNAVIL